MAPNISQVLHAVIMCRMGIRKTEITHVTEVSSDKNMHMRKAEKLKLQALSLAAL